MFSLVQRALFRFSSYWWLYGLASAFLLIQVLHSGIPGDSTVFFKAGLDVREGMNPWVKSEDSINFQFLNGPLFSILCAILSYFGSLGMYAFTCLTSLALIPWCVLFAGRLFGIEIETKYLSGISTLLILTFPVRANLQYGQFVIFYVFLLLVILNFYRNAATRATGDFAIGFGFLALLDFKPHLFLIWVFILVRPQRIFLRVGFLAAGLVELSVLKMITGTFLPKDWFLRLFDRGHGSDGLAGFYNLHTFISQTSLTPGWEFLLNASMVLFFSVVSFHYMSSKASTFILLYLALFPIMHPQDLFILLLFAITLIPKKQWSRLDLFTVGLGLVWSSNPLALGINSIFVVSFYITFLCNKKLIKSILELNLLIFPSLLIQACANFGIAMDSYRIAANVLSVLGALMIVGSYSRNNGFKRLIWQLIPVQKS